MSAKIKNSNRRHFQKGVRIACFAVIAPFLFVFLFGLARFVFAPYEEGRDQDLLYHPEPVPAEQNAFCHIVPLVQHFETNEISLDLFQVEDGLIAEESVTAAAALAAEHPELFRAFYDLAKYKYCQVPLIEDMPLFEQDLNFSTAISMIDLGKASLCYVECLMREERAEEAADCLLAHARLGQKAHRDSYVLAVGMLASALKSQVLTTVLDNLSRGSFEFDQHQILLKIVERCQDDEGWINMVKGEYMSMKYPLTQLDPFGWGGFPGMYDKSITLQRYEDFWCQTISAFNDPDAVQPDYLDCYPYGKSPTSLGWCRMFLSGNSVGELLICVGIPSISGITDRKWKQSAKADLIRLYVATWEFYEEHGALPETLEQLVPAQTAELPRDPFNEAGGTYGFDPSSQEISSTGHNSNENVLKISLGFLSPPMD